MIFSVIHISDLHFKKDHPSLHRLRRLRDDILEYKNNHPLYIAFSGDLVQAGDEDLYAILFDEFFAPLNAKLSRIYLAPENHDIQQETASKLQCDKLLSDRELTYLFDENGSVQSGNPFVNADPLSNFSILNEIISSYQETSFFGSYDNNPHFSIASLNSAWLSYRRSEGETDRGNLRVDPPICQYYIDNLSDDAFKVFMMHHPLDWLEEDARQTTENLLTAHFDLILLGHNHNPTSVSGAFNAGPCLMLHAPAIHSNTSTGLNSYSIVHIDATHKRYEIVYRSYSQPRDCFIAGEDLAPNGIKYPTPEDRTHWHRIRTQTASELIARLPNSDPIDFDDWYDKHFIAKTKSRHTLVEPRVTRVKPEGTERLGGVSQRLCTALGSRLHRQFVVGPQDSGLTSAAFVFCRHVAVHCDLYKAVPVYVNLNKLQINRATLLREAGRTSPVRFTHREIETLATEGGLLYIFDQIGLPESKQMTSILRTLDRYFPKCPSVFFCAADGGLLGSGSGEDSDDINIDPTKDTMFELTQFDVEEILDLIRNQRSAASPTEQQKTLTRVVSSFKQMSEPVYPSAVSVLVETLKQSPDFKPVNRARLIDRYVECLLGRFEWEDVAEGTFNSNDKVTFLAYVAGHFAMTGRSEITPSSWDELCRNYSAERLLDLPSGLLEEFTLKGILMQQGGSITFRADYLFTYFVAKEMNLNPEIYRFIAAKDAFFRNYRELVFYGELEGVDNARLLNDTFERVSRLEEEIVAKYQEDGLELDKEWRQMLHENATEDLQRRDEAAASAVASKPSAESVKHALSTDLRTVDRGRGVFTRADVRELEAQWLVAIRTYFQLVKHSGGLAGTEKIRHLSKAAESAELFIKSLAAKRDQIGTKVVHFHGGVMYIYPFAGVDSERARREFKMSASYSVAQMVVDHMNNPQLAPVYRKILAQGNEVVQFLMRHLLLEIPAAPNRRAFVKNLGSAKEPMLQTCSLIRLREKYLSYSVSDGETEFYGEVISEIAQKSNLINNLEHEQLRKKRLLANMRDKVRK